VFRGDSENTESQEGREKSPPGITCAYILKISEKERFLKNNAKNIWFST